MSNISRIYPYIFIEYGNMIIIAHFRRKLESIIPEMVKEQKKICFTYIYMMNSIRKVKPMNFILILKLTANLLYIFRAFQLH